jgi:hypothetical protein
VSITNNYLDDLYILSIFYLIFFFYQKLRRTFRYILAATSSSETVRRCEFLKKCIFLDPLPIEFFGKLASALDTTSFEDGQYIIRQGEQGDSFFIIEEGAVRCTQIKANGREVDLM